jgi:RimJ/RimL family protein N-acetyltransferase
VDGQALITAPAELNAQRVVLYGPRPEFGPVIVASINRSLPGLRFIGWGQRERAAEFGAEFIAYDLKVWAQGECLVYYAFERDSGAYVGRVDLHSWDFDTPRCEVGYVGDVLTAGRGLMREAVLSCVDLAFKLGAARVQALSEADNHRALHFAEHALGFTREGLLRNYERDAQGQLGEQVMFAAYRPGAV